MSEWVINILQLIAIHLLVGSLITLLFLIFTGLLRPSIQISTVIIKRELEGQTGKRAYMIEIVNKSRRAAVDVKARLALVQEKTVLPGKITRATNFELEKDSLEGLAGRGRGALKARIFRFVTYDEIETKWNSANAFLTFVVYAKDSLTGFNKVFRMKYDLDQITFEEASIVTGRSREMPNAL